MESLSYTVKRGFPHEGVWYTRDNAHEVKELPRALRDQLIEQGVIEEHRGATPDAAPASPAETTSKARK